ncbi:MAG: hypothetical protein M1541_04970 [Acidobacteria bacterium]|nr:hypothetical protein [Acidobacteriota bacterium]
MDQSDIVVESMTQSAEDLQKLLEDEGYDSVEITTLTDHADDQPPAAEPAADDDTTSSAPSADAGGNAGTEESETGDPGAESETAHEQSGAKKPGGFKRKIQQKDAEISTLKTELEGLKRQLAEISAAKAAPESPTNSTPAGQGAGEPPAETPDDDPEPQLEDCDDYAEYTKKLTAWAIRQERKKSEDAGSKTTESARKAAAPSDEQRAEAERWNSRIAEAREKHPDFDQVALSPQVAASPVMVAAAQQLDEGPELAYWLGQHPEESKRIAELTTLPQNATQQQITQAFRRVYVEFDKIAAQLNAPSSAASRETREPPAQPERTQPSPAPKPKMTPPNPVGGRGASNARTLTEEDPDVIRSVSNEEWRKARGMR